MGKGNNMIPNGHFHKDWEKNVKTHFNQPLKKITRRRKRAEKAVRIAPRPTAGALRPQVRCPTFKYNTKVRVGRGYTLNELKVAGVNKKYAKTIGIAVDYRRRNKSTESLQANVQRLKEYMGRLIVLPTKGALNEEVVQITDNLIPIKSVLPKQKARAIAEEEKKYSAFVALRQARSHQKLAGKRAKRAKEAANENKV